MSIGQEFISGMELHGSNKVKVIAFLNKLKAKYEKESKTKKQANTFERIVNVYIDVYEYTFPSKSVLENLAKRLNEVKPILLESLEVAEGEDEKAIQAILENYNYIQKNISTSFFGSLRNSIDKAWKSPSDFEEED